MRRRLLASLDFDPGRRKVLLSDMDIFLLADLVGHVHDAQTHKSKHEDYSQHKIHSSVSRILEPVKKEYRDQR